MNLVVGAGGGRRSVEWLLKGEGRGRRVSTAAGENKPSSYKANREEIDRSSGRVSVIFKLFGFASLRKSWPL
jgi:hypothetical protein